MKSLIFQTTVRLLHPLLLTYSVFLLLLGHDEPGGGFPGGLVAAVSFVLVAIAYDTREARRILRVDPQKLLGAGLLAALVSGMIGVGRGQPFLTGVWATLTVPGTGKLEVGTPLLFELGVYLVVLGGACLILFTLSEA